MPPILALFFWLVLLFALLHLDPARDSSFPLALWVPVAWLFIVASRLPSQWLAGEGRDNVRALEDGSPVDRSIYLFLMVLAIIVLISRSFRWSHFFNRNLALIAFLIFALVSASWSDFPLVCFKRWVRDFGSTLIILVVLSNPGPTVAVRAVLRRLCYLLIPLSILLIKYFPEISTQYDTWTGARMYVGPTTSKNMLGAFCLIAGVFFFWDTVARWSDRREGRVKRVLIVNAGFMAMTLWLLHLSRSATSTICLLLGCLVIAAAQSRAGKRHPKFLKVVIPSAFVLYIIAAYGFGLNGELAGAIGRDPTLTDRTLIWKTLIGINTNTLVGTGYETFWLGPRLQKIWQHFGPINEAHNGYLEVYLNLGVIGLLLLIGFLAASYKMICKRLSSPHDCGSASLYLALWTILIFYNVTESAAFKFHPLWVTFLIGAIAVSESAEDRVRVTKVDGVRFGAPLSEGLGRKGRFSQVKIRGFSRVER